MRWYVFEKPVVVGTIRNGEFKEYYQRLYGNPGSSAEITVLVPVMEIRPVVVGVMERRWRWRWLCEPAAWPQHHRAHSLMAVAMRMPVLVLQRDGDRSWLCHLDGQQHNGDADDQRRHVP